MITFPDWVQGPTGCKWRTFSCVIPGDRERQGPCHHGALRMESQFVNRPVRTVVFGGRNQSVWD